MRRFATALPPLSADAEPRYYTAAVEGPRAGECSVETYSLAQLRSMRGRGHLPADLPVFRVGSGGEWTTIAEEIAGQAGGGGEQGAAVEKEQRTRAASKIAGLIRGFQGRRQVRALRAGLHEVAAASGSAVAASLGGAPMAHGWQG